jgi:hypothetical protein
VRDWRIVPDHRLPKKFLSVTKLNRCRGYHRPRALPADFRLTYPDLVPEQQQPRPEPPDPPMLPFAIAGIVIWAAVGLVLLIFFRDWLIDRGHQNWLWTCLAGALIGLPGVAVMIRHDAHRRRRRAG